MNVSKYDTFEKLLIAVMILVTLFGFYYARTICLMAAARVYDANIPTNVLLFLLVETSILNGVILYSLLKRK